MGKRIQRVDIDKMNTKLLELGYQEENIHTEVQIDCTGVLWDYPDATAEMTVQAPNGEKYPVVPELTTDNVVVWDVTDSDLVYAGSGKIQLTLKNGDEVIKSATCSTRIMESITATGSAPTPLENWMQQAEETAHQIALTAKDEVIEQIQDAAEEARESIPADYTQLSDDVTGLKSAFEQLDANVITESAGPAPIVSIADGADGMPMRSVEVAIEPVQDLHGYEYPWPAGGGKNLFPPIETTTSYGVTFTQDGDYINISGTPSGNAFVDLFRGTLPSGTYTFNGVTGASNASYRTAIRINDDTSWAYNSDSQRTFTLESESQVRITLFVYPAYGTFDNFKIQYQLERGDTVTPWTPYSNICPISGWTGVKVTRTGKNLFDIEKCRSDTITVVDGVMSGTASNFSRNFANENSLFLFEQDVGRVVLSFDAKTDANQGETGQGLVFNINYTDGSRTRMSIPNSTTTYTRFTLASEANKIVSRINVTYSTLGSNIWYLKDIQIELDSEVTDFEPYQGQIYEVTFPADPGTVYGGTLDVATGKLVVDRAMSDLGSLAWTIDTLRFKTVQLVSIIKRVSSNTEILAGLICEMYRAGSNNNTGAASVYDNIIAVSAAGNLFVKDTRYTTVADFVSAVTGTKVVYPLANPQEITLSPTEIKTLLGINNIWADTGDTAITYPADTKMYIDRKITEAVANALNA